MATRGRIVLVAVLLAIVALALGQASSASAQARIHCVRPGETLYRIGAYYGVSPYLIAQHNGIANPAYIQAGWCLRIPPASGTFGCSYPGCQPKPAVQPCYPQPCQPKPVVQPCYPQPCQPKPVVQPCTPPRCGGPTYTRYCVRPCDTLFAIGRRFGVSPWAIASLNGLSNPNYIRVGQCLLIPTR